MAPWSYSVLIKKEAAEGVGLVTAVFRLSARKRLKRKQWPRELRPDCVDLHMETVANIYGGWVEELTIIVTQAIVLREHVKDGIIKPTVLVINV